MPLAHLDREVSGHYTQGHLLDVIFAKLREAGHDPAALEADDLSPADEFHIGGREATARFIDKLGLSAEDRVLDVGCGIGGASRYVARQHGCQVMGVDLTEQYCDVATELAGRVRLADRVAYQQASALTLPFVDGRYSAAYMLHVGMNISDKPALWRELHRVLEPGGRLGVYDVLRGTDDGLQFPVPRARVPETSFLASIDEMRITLEAAGFSIESECDRGDFAREFFHKLQAGAASGPPPLGIHLLMGGDFSTKIANLRANLEARRCGPWEIVCVRR